jgi:uncharacterized repeat protein (TIGR01451 family)
MKWLSPACASAWRGLLHVSLLLGCSALLALAASGPVRAQAGCTAGACVTAGPRLVSVDSTQGPLLNLLFQSLLPGTSVNLSVLDWNAIATADVNLNALISQLGTNLSLSDPSQVLDADITLAQLRLAMTQVLAADGNTAAVNALNLLPLNAAGLAGTFQLGDLLQISLPQGSLADIDLDVLDLLTGSVQLYNFQNVLTTPSPVTVDTAALGLAGVASVEQWLQVVEPPVYVCGPQGTQFHTAAIRAKSNFEILNGFNLAPVISAINSLGLAGISNLSLTQGLLDIDVYAEVARAQGTITQIDALAQTVTVQAEPGIVDLYIGDPGVAGPADDDAVFFNRSNEIDATDFVRQDISSLNLSFNVSILGVGVVAVQVPLTVSALAVAEGDPALQTLAFSGAYPETQTITCGTLCVGNLVTSLINNLNLDVRAGTISATVGGIPVSGLVLTNIVNNFVNPMITVIESTLQAETTTIIQPALNTVLGGVLDPILHLLGIGIGEAVVTVEGIAVSCSADITIAKSDNSLTYTPGGTATYAITVSNAGPAAVTDAAVSDTLPDGVTLSGAWTCSVTQGTGACDPGSGGAAGGQAINLTVDLSAGGVVTINVPVTFSANPAAY